MEFTRLLNFSLDLNAKPLRFMQKEEVPKSSFIGLGINSNTVNVKEDKDALIEEVNRASAENKKLSELLAIATENYTDLKNQLLECSNNYNTSSRKRKADIQVLSLGPSHSSSSSDEESSSKKQRGDQIKPKISRVCLRAEASDKTLIVKDGYQWRKYGQKVTRDNPCPRAYFKCSFAPTCPVKKKVQRSMEDQSVVVATYEGEHNHPQPAKVESTTTSTSNKSSILGSSTSVSSTATLDFTKPKPVKEETINVGGKVDAFQHYFVEQMASTLTKDPNFKAALVAAISGKFLQSNSLTEIVEAPRVMK